MAAASLAPEFLNRNSERAHLETLLANVRAGHSAALVLRGEAGVGKTALLRYAAPATRDERRGPRGRLPASGPPRARGGNRRRR